MYPLQVVMQPAAGWTPELGMLVLGAVADPEPEDPDEVVLVVDDV